MTQSQRWSSLFLLLAISMLFAGSAWADPPLANHVPEEIIIKFKSNASDHDKAAVLGDLRATKIKHFKRINSDLHRISGVSVGEAVGRYKNHPKVEFIEPNYYLSAVEIPNDPRFPELWGLQNTGQTQGTPGADISAVNAWDVFTGSDQVVIGVIDTGVDYNHPDLAANMWTNPGEIPNNGIDDDNNGFIDDVYGWDFINNDNDPMDDNGHGTHCSGTIGAVGNNGIGVAGVNWNVKIMALKFLSAGGSGSTADAVDAIEYATMMGVRLTSNSWGGGGFSTAMEQAIADANAAGILFVAAAGNSSSNNDVSPHYPSNYDLPNVVAVAATNHNDDLASFSSYGATTVDLAAPGVDILSTFPGNSYGTLSGTSMATPHVAGALGLVFGRFPAIGGADAKSLLLNFVDPLPSLAGRVLTEGRLNAFFPIADPDTIPPGAITDLLPVEAGSNWMVLNWTAPGDDGYEGTASRYDVRYATFPIDETNFDTATQAMGTPDPGPVGTPESMRVDGLDFDTTYYFAAIALDEFGNAGDVSNSPSATTLGIPDIAHTPASFTETLLTGATATQTLTLSNVGFGTLDFSVPIPVLLGAPPSVAAFEEYGKDEIDPRVGEPVVQGSGGPDGFGYRWNDSDDPFGPAFDWFDISGMGSVAISTGDDVSAGPLPIGFDFPFYGGEYAEFWVSSNGFLSLSSSASPYSNQPLPSAGAPPHMIAPFWDDLVVGAGDVYYYNDGTRLIVQFHELDHYGSGGPYTFQAILYPDGTIDYQYLSMADPLSSATIGMQNGTGTDGLTVAFNTAYMHDDLAIRIRAIPQWLTVTPAEGTIYAPNSTTLDVQFDSTGLLGGGYDGVIRILSNDPDESEVQIPVALTVIGAPDIQVEPLSYDFGGVFLGASPSAEFIVRNIGTDFLTVSSTAFSSPEYSIDVPAMSIPPRSAQIVNVTFTPFAVGGYPATMTFYCDDPDEPQVTVSLNGAGLEPPQFAISPTSLSSDLLTGGTEQQTLNISNSGGADFEFSLTVDFESSVTVYESPELGKDDVDTRVGEPVTAGTGGPDNFGYSWIDSDEPGGPAFNWVDISATGTPVFTATGDDRNFGPFPIPFAFPFYGNDFSEFRVCSNGWVSFTNTTTDLSNDPLPASGAPENLLAAFWDDLVVDLSIGGNVYYEYDGTRFIIQYDNVRRFASGGPYTFQILLYPNGNIVYQYLSMQGTRLDEATIGIQNDARDDGLTVVFNAEYVHDNLAVRFAFAPEWLTVTPSSGVLTPGESLDLTARFNADGLFGGTYLAHINFTTNDPSLPTLDVPATLNVTGAPNIGASDLALDFGQVMVGYPDLLNLVVFNDGTDNLVITDVLIDNPDYQVNVIAPIFLAPTGQLLMDVRFSPSSPGPSAATLSFVSNDPDLPVLEIALSGEGIIAPVASVNPTSVSSDLFTGETETQQVVLTNSGGSDLTFTAQPLITATEQTVHPSVEIGKDEADTRPGILGSGGPDLFGYSWIDSDEPGGPAFDWVDISATGIPVFSATGDDRNFGPFPVGFEFPFYENSFSEFRVSSNGWVSFTNTTSDLSNDPLPASGAPENLLAAWWDDLVVDLSIGGNVYYLNDGGRLIIQYDNVRRFASGGPYTFQILLYPNGTIFYQYLSMQGTRLDEATIGIQNATRDDGLTVVFNDDYVHDNLAVRIATTPPWLTVNPTAGTVPPGGSLPLDVTFDATGLFGGTYDGIVQLQTNDPANGVIDVSAQLNVTGIPLIAFDPAALDFGTVYVGVTESRTLLVSNAGTDLLSVTDVMPTSAEFTVSPTTFDLLPLESIVLTVDFLPTADGDRSADLVFTSNVAGSPNTVPMAAFGVWPPIIGVDPASIEAAAMPGGQKVKTLTICNTGGSDLNFAVAEAQDATGVPVYDELTLPKQADEAGSEEAVDPRPSILGTGGPDLFGYTWIDSDEPGGPAFDWVDITTVGTPVPFSAYVDDGNVGPVPIGFDFPFYGNSFSELYACSNGWMSFTNSTLRTFTNQPLPNSGSSVPENLLAPWWDDMVYDESDGNYAYFYNDGSRFIITYYVRRIAAFTPPFYEFQVILYPNGNIVYQYNGLGTRLNSTTIGIQNGTKDDGLTVVHNDGSYAHENLAILFSAAPDWLSVEPASGVVPAGECVDLTVTFDASELEDGDYTGTIDISSNDPFNPLVTVPVLLHVGTVDAMWADVDPNTLNLDSNGRWITGRLELPVEYDPSMIVVETVSLLETVPADDRVYELGDDYDGNGIPDAMFKFDRMATEEILPEGEAVEIIVTGEIRDTIWFVARDVIRVIRPRLMSPNGGDLLVGNTAAMVTWENPDGWNVDSAELLYSPDNGVNWQVVATGIQGTSYEWTVPIGDTEEGRVRVNVYDRDGILGYDSSDAVFTVSGAVTAVDQPAVPTAYALGQNTPNPFNPQTIIRFDLPVASRTVLKIFDAKGRVVRTLVSDDMPAGFHEVIWRGEDDSGNKVASGVYFYQIQAADYAARKSMVMLK